MTKTSYKRLFSALAESQQVVALQLRSLDGFLLVRIRQCHVDFVLAEPLLPADGQVFGLRAIPFAEIAFVELRPAADQAYAPDYLAVADYPGE